MIYSDGMDAVVESVMMAKELTPYSSKAKYIVNPRTLSHLGKILIISMPMDYQFLIELSRNNKIISRIKLPDFIPHTFEPWSKTSLGVVKTLFESGRTITDKNFKSMRVMRVGDQLLMEMPKRIEDNEDYALMKLIKNSISL